MSFIMVKFMCKAIAALLPCVAITIFVVNGCADKRKFEATAAALDERVAATAVASAADSQTIGELESADRENDAVVPKEVSDAESLAAKYDWKRVWKGVTCKEYTTDDEYTKHRDCFFPNAKLKQVFDIVKISDVNIRTELPETNLNDTCFQKGCIEVDFQYKSKKHLFIKIRYNGGEDEIEIIEKDGGTIAKEVWGID